MGHWKGLHADSNSPFRGMTREQMVDTKRERRMSRVDAFDPEVRKLVHEYGLTIVDAIYSLGVKKPNQIRHIVETVLNEFSPTRGSYSSQGRRGDGDGIDAGPMKRKVQP